MYSTRKFCTLKNLRVLYLLLYIYYYIIYYYIYTIIIYYYNISLCALFSYYTIEQMDNSINSFSLSFLKINKKGNEQYIFLWISD